MFNNYLVYIWSFIVSILKNMHIMVIVKKDEKHINKD